MKQEFDLLKDLFVLSRINQSESATGLDSHSGCLYKEIWSWWPESVSYKFNSRGFRDREWPQDLDQLRQCVWCIGDSFTVGLGANREHTWPAILEQNLNRRTINISMDGASNQWIARQALQIIHEVGPQTMILHWSYTHRRESQILGSDEDRRIFALPAQTNDGMLEDLESWADSASKVERGKQHTDLVHSFIPKWSGEPINRPGDPAGVKTHQAIMRADLAKIIYEFKQLDFSRDAHHYYKNTAAFFCHKIIQKIGR